mgnify:CR=1 FL=1
MYFEKIKSLLAERFDVSEDSINLETKIIEDLKADSLDVVDMLMTIEDEYDISIPDDIAQDMKTVGDVVAYLDENVK